MPRFSDNLHRREPLSGMRIAIKDHRRLRVGKFSKKAQVWPATAQIGRASRPIERRYVIACLVEFAKLRRMVQCDPPRRESADAYRHGEPDEAEAQQRSRPKE